ncbi:TfoX/Sxy family protein (plasmid) [Paracoccus sp. TK19116]|uniref:TfoX/Sxy family protein n=1 Tax=Paracoccus albicereus TaxID=2922394 RepID=A0ABT1MLA7_9RHOB|nr:TfoX/Sxy family protein [Paracoccus albicereus]MCQ0969072.1 TfoX/Sxy family protein [Paracoccus albicereus]
MAADPGSVVLMRDDLCHLGDFSEKAMFGGMGFMRDGHMLAGVMSDGGMMYRVGKPRESEALRLPGVGPMQSGARRMGGFVVISGSQLADDDLRRRLLDLALTNATELPLKD